MVLNAKLKKMMALNVKLKQTMALNAKMKMQLWTLNWKRYGGSERLTEERHYDSKCWTEDMTLNVKLKKNNNIKY